MTPDARLTLRGMLARDEQYRQHPYTDTTGHLTIGYGRNLDDRGILPAEALYLLDEDITYFTDKLSSHLRWFRELDEPRQMVLISMCYNLGLQGLLGFTHFMLAMEAGDHERAAAEMLDSRWAAQVGERAARLASIIRTGSLKA